MAIKDLKGYDDGGKKESKEIYLSKTSCLKCPIEEDDGVREGSGVIIFAKQEKMTKKIIRDIEKECEMHPSSILPIVSFACSVILIGRSRRMGSMFEVSHVGIHNTPNRSQAKRVI